MNTQQLRENFLNYMQSIGCPYKGSNETTADWWLSKLTSYQQSLIAELEGKKFVNTARTEIVASSTTKEAFNLALEDAINIIKQSME